jgi:thioredoxin-related protein
MCILKKLINIIAFAILFQAVKGQEKGIIFIQDSNWSKILSAAKTENKYIFVDCYTTWCGPCKYMEANVFPTEEVGNFFNEKFICVKFQIDTTSNDTEKIKLKYEDAAFIKNKYKVNGFPTYLFFNPLGELVHRALGSCTTEEFIVRGTNALDVEKQYYTQIRKYEAGNRNASFLKNLTLQALNAQDESAISKYANDYYSTQKNLLDSSNLFFIYQTTLNVADTGFTLMCNNLGKFETVVEKKRLQTTLQFIIIRSEFLLNNNIGQDWDNNKWNSFVESLSKKYPLFAKPVLLQFKLMTFPRTNNWKGYADAVESYVAIEYPGNSELNEYAWAIFGKCNDKPILERALVWSKRTFTDQKKIEPGYIDTYANLLYKIGRKSEALQWEKKAQKIAIEQGQDRSWGQDVIDKINKGEKTW